LNVIARETADREQSNYYLILSLKSDVYFQFVKGVLLH